METINTLELTDESVYPDEKILKGVLENSFSAYCELLQLFASKNMEGEWRYYKDGKAWLCKVQFKKKNYCVDVCVEGFHAGNCVCYGSPPRRSIRFKYQCKNKRKN